MIAGQGGIFFSGSKIYRCGSNLKITDIELPPTNSYVTWFSHVVSAVKPEHNAEVKTGRHLELSHRLTRQIENWDSPAQKVTTLRDDKEGWGYTVHSHDIAIPAQEFYKDGPYLDILTYLQMCFILSNSLL